MINQRWCVFAVLMFTSTRIFSADGVHQWTTEQGMPVYFYQSASLPMVDVRLVFRAGASRDGEQSGVSSLVSSLLTDGTAQRDADTFSEQFEATGARLSSGSLRDMAWVSLRSLTDEAYLSPATELLGELLQQPRFDPEALERLKAQVIKALKSGEQDPGTQSNKAFWRLLYQDHPYARSATAEDYQVISAEQLRDFYQTHYVAKNGVMALVGDLSLVEAKALSRRLGSRLAAGLAAPELPLAPLSDEGRTERLSLPSEQTHVIIGFPWVAQGDPDHYALQVANYILGGGGFSSRLMQRLREDYGLVYGVSSGFTPMEGRGPFSLRFQTKAEQLDQALDLTRQTLQELVEEGLSEDEFSRAVSYLLGSVPRQLDSNGDWVRHLAYLGFYDLPLDRIARFTQALNALTREQVNEALARRLQLDTLHTVIVGPETPDAAKNPPPS